MYGRTPDVSLTGLAGLLAVDELTERLGMVASSAHHAHYYGKHARLQAGLPTVHFHHLRHAGLTLSAQGGATLAEVMRRAGHSSAAAALRYQHAADRRDAVIASRLSLLAAERGTEPPSDDAHG